MSKSLGDAGTLNLLDDAGRADEEDQAGGDRHRDRGALRPGGQARGVEPAGDPRRGHRPRPGRRRAGLRRPGLRRAEGRPRPTPWSPSPSRSPRARASCSAIPPSSTGSWPPAPSGRRASPPTTLRRAYDPVGFLRRPGGDRRSDARPGDGRRRDRRSRSRTPTCSPPGAGGSATRPPTWSSRTSRCCRRPRSRAADLPDIEKHLAEVAARAAAVHRCTSPARARSVRPRRWCSCRWRAGWATARSSRRSIRARPARARARLPVPPARHGRAGHRRRRARRGLRRAGRLRRAVPGRPRSCCSPATRTSSWHWRTEFTLGGEPRRVNAGRW